jgi:hypothetical protein
LIFSRIVGSNVQVCYDETSAHPELICLRRHTVANVLSSFKKIENSGTLTDAQVEAVESLFGACKLTEMSEKLLALTSTYEAAVSSEDPAAILANKLVTVEDVEGFVNLGVDTDTATGWVAILAKIEKLENLLAETHAALEGKIVEFAKSVTPEVAEDVDPATIAAEIREADSLLTKRLAALGNLAECDIVNYGPIAPIYSTLAIAAKQFAKGVSKPSVASGDRRAKVNLGDVSYRFVTETDNTIEFSEAGIFTGAKGANDLVSGLAAKLRNAIDDDKLGSLQTVVVRINKRGSEVPTIVECTLVPMTAELLKAQGESVEALEGESI